MAGWLQNLPSRLGSVTACFKTPCAESGDHTRGTEAPVSWSLSVDLGYFESGKAGLREWRGFHFWDTRARSQICNNDYDCDEWAPEEVRPPTLSRLSWVQPCQL